MLDVSTSQELRLSVLRETLVRGGRRGGGGSERGRWRAAQGHVPPYARAVKSRRGWESCDGIDARVKLNYSIRDGCMFSRSLGNVCTYAGARVYVLKCATSIREEYTDVGWDYDSIETKQLSQV